MIASRGPLLPRVDHGLGSARALGARDIPVSSCKAVCRRLHPLSSAAILESFPIDAYAYRVDHLLKRVWPE
jgi:hypothetical protein